MMPAIRKSVDVKIELSDSPILLIGHPEESAGKLLRGVLHVNTTEPIKVKSISLRFVGKMKVSWSEGLGHHQHYYKQERTIMERSWQFIPMATTSSQKKTYCLAAGEHRFNFELMLPGDLPQSLDAEGGQVLYRFKAMVERPAFVHNIVKKRYIKVVRSILPSVEFELSQSMEIHNTWVDKMTYDIVMPSKIYALGETITMTFNISPIAPELKVRSICASLKEYCSYTTRANSKMDTRIIHYEKLQDPFPHYAALWSRDVTLDVPANSPLIFCNTENDMIKIRHKMKFVISLMNADGHLSELRCSVPVVVVDSFADQNDNMLPAYDQSWRSVPYDPAVFEALRRSSVSQPQQRMPSRLDAATNHHQNQSSLSTPSSSSPSSPASSPPSSPLPSPSIAIQQQQQQNSSSRAPITISGRARTLSITTLSASPSNNNNNNSSSIATGQGNPCQQVDPWWQGMDLSRVPSYNSSANLDHVALSSSLPAYDQLACTPRV